MKVRHLTVTLVAAALAAATFAADEPEQKPTPNAREMLNALIRAEAAKKQAANPAAASAAKPADESGPLVTPKPGEARTPKPEPTTAEKDAKTKDAAAKASAEPATVLPKVQVNQSRVNEIDRQIYEQNKEIAHEKQNTKQTEVDKALNDSKVSKALAIFGGESSQHRAGLAGERVKIMEEEKDLLEAMKTAKTKDEKAELQKQLDELRAYRRDLEKSLR